MRPSSLHYQESHGEVLEYTELADGCVQHADRMDPSKAEPGQTES